MNPQDLMSALLSSTKNISQRKFERILKSLFEICIVVCLEMFSIGLGVTKIIVISIIHMVMDFFPRLKNHLLIIGSKEIWNSMT
jgi:hypothetical protein